MSQDSKGSSQLQQLIKILNKIYTIQIADPAAPLQQKKVALKQLNDILAKISINKVQDPIGIALKYTSNSIMSQQQFQQQRNQYYLMLQKFVIDVLGKLAAHGRADFQKFRVLVDVMGRTCLFDRSVIKTNQDNNKTMRSGVFEKLKWVQDNTQNININITFYKCLDSILQQLTRNSQQQQQQQQQKISFPLFLEQLSFYSVFSPYIKKKKLFEHIKQIFKSLKNLSKNQQKLKQFTKNITPVSQKILKKCVEDIVKEIEKDSKNFYNFQIINLKKSIQTSINQFGAYLLLMSHSIEKRLIGLRMIYNQMQGDLQFFKWIKQKYIFQAILKQTNQFAFFNSSQFIFKGVLKNIKENKHYLTHILQCLTKSTQQIRKIILKYLQSSTDLLQTPQINQQLLKSLFLSQKPQFYTQQLFNLLSKILVHSNFKNQQLILQKCVKIYLQTINHKKNTTLSYKCKNIINQCLTKIFQRKMLSSNDVDIREKIRIVTYIYQVLSHQPISHQKLGLISIISSRIFQRCCLSYQNKETISSFLIKDLNIVEKGLNWIRNTNDQSLIQQVQSLIHSLLQLTPQKIKYALIQTDSILIEATQNPKIFQSLLKLKKKQH